MATTIYKDPFSGSPYLSEKSCIEAVQQKYRIQLQSLGVSARQAIFNVRNRKPIGTKNGKSVISGKPTVWNEVAGRYERFADDAERAKYRQMFIDRMQKTYGKTHLLNEPDQQRLMLASRSISGTYKFQDGTEKTYTGKEEEAILKFLDVVMRWPGSDVFCPAPQNFYYVDDSGTKRFYIPDVYIESINLIIEVKGELHNGYRKRDMLIEKAKDSVLETSGYAYVKVEDRDYDELVEAIERARKKQDDEDQRKLGN